MKKHSGYVIRVKKGMSTICYSFFSALSNPTRLAIIETLLEQPKSVGHIAVELGQEQSMISHNLRTLSQCKFVEARREGKKRVYNLNYETLDPLLKLVENHFNKFCLNGDECTPINKSMRRVNEGKRFGSK
jgi:DNA-binding transcriptional ArsR family regulator